MSRILTVQAELKTHLEAQTFFTTPTAIPVITQNVRNIQAEVTEAMTKFNLCCVLVTPSVRGFEAVANARRIGQLSLVAACYEIPALNKSGVTALDLAEAVIWHAYRFTPSGEKPFTVDSLELIPDAEQGWNAWHVNLIGSATLITPPTRP